MYHFKIPKPQKLQFQKTDPITKVVTQGEVPYDFQSFLAEFAWPAREFRVSAESAAALYIAQDELLEKVEGDDAFFDTTTWNIVKPILTLAGKELPPNLAIPLSKLMRPVMLAKLLTAEEVAEIKAAKLAKTEKAAAKPEPEAPPDPAEAKPEP
jgi:hypothetical protein